MALPFETVEISNWIGLDTRENIAGKDPQRVEDCQNVDFDNGVICKRRGTVNVLAAAGSGRVNLLYDFQSQQGFTTSVLEHRIVVSRSDSLSVYQEDFSTLDATFSVSNCNHYAVSSDNGACIITNENATEPKVLGYSKLFEEWFYSSMTLETPSSASFTFTNTGFGSGDTWSVCVTYVDQWGNESNPSEAKTWAGNISYIAVDTSSIVVSSDHSFYGMNFYAQVGTFTSA